MNIMNVLTPAERRMLNEALENAETRSSVASPAMKGSSRALFLPEIDRKDSRRGKPTGCSTMERISRQERQEYELWMSVERSLEHPFVYRTDASKELAINMLRRIPRLKDLSVRDLEIMTSTMRMVHINDGVVLLGDRPKKVESNVEYVDYIERYSTFGNDETDIVAERSTTANLASKVERDVASLNEDVLDHQRDDSNYSPARSSVRQCSGKYVYVLLRGSVQLRLPSLRCPMDVAVELYEMFGLPTTLGALPENAFYQTCTDCVLLCFPRNKEYVMDGVIKRLDKRLLQEQTAFLQQHLRVKIFTHWTQQEYERCARALVPLHVSWRQMVVEQGMESDAMYFIKEGQCVVVRNVPLLRGRITCSGRAPDSVLPCSSPSANAKGRVSQPGSGAEAALAPPSASPTRDHQLNASPQHTKVVEVATLREGEFFGELGLLSHKVDRKPDVGKIRSEAYWRTTLCSARDAPTDYTLLEGEVPLEVVLQPGSGEQLAPGETESAPALPTFTLEPTNRFSMFPQSTMERQASVHTRCPCDFYMLPYERCRELFGAREYAQLKEFANGYPSREDIATHYERQRKWSKYRKTLVNDVLYDAEVLRQISHDSCSRVK